MQTFRAHARSHGRSASRAALHAAAVGAMAALVGCAATPSAEPGVPDADGPVATASSLPTQEVERVVVTGYSAAELSAEFERARSLLLVDRFSDAAKAFDRLRLLARGGELGAPSSYNAGLAHEGAGALDLAIERYRELAAEYPDAAAARGGIVRLTRLLGYLERWQELAEAADQLLDDTGEVPVMDRIEALGAKALGLVEQGKLEEAEPYARKAQDLIEEHRFGETGTPPLQLAQVAFARGEIARLKSERIVLVPVPPNFPEVLEQRCQGLLDAQSAYSDAMRSRDAHWSAMSGFRVGQLYQQLHAEAMQIPPPATARTQRDRDLFEAAVRMRYQILIEKGLKMMNATIRMGERTGEASPWIARARAAKGELERAIEEEKAAFARMPFTQDEIKAALEKVKNRNKPGAPKGNGGAPNGPSPPTPPDEAWRG